MTIHDQMILGLRFLVRRLLQVLLEFPLHYLIPDKFIMEIILRTYKVMIYLYIFKMTGFIKFLFGLCFLKRIRGIFEFLSCIISMFFLIYCVTEQSEYQEKCVICLI